MQLVARNENINFNIQWMHIGVHANEIEEKQAAAQDNNPTLLTQFQDSTYGREKNYK